jgi:hypothetical protein
MKQTTQHIFLDVDNVLIYQDQLTNEIVYNQALIRALKAASLTEITLLTSMALRDVPERQKLVTHLKSQGITVQSIYSKLDLKLDQQVLGRVWRLAQDSVTYNKEDGSLVVYDDRLKPLRTENASADEKNIKLDGRNYDMTPKGKVLVKFLADHKDENVHCLFIDDSSAEIASARDAFEPSKEEVNTNNLIDTDRLAENPLLRTLVLSTARGVLVTHFNSKELDENTFEGYAKTFLTFRMLCLDEKLQIKFRSEFEKIVHKGGKKLESKITTLFDELSSARSLSTAFSSSSEEAEDRLRTQSASTSATSSTSRRGGRGSGAAGGLSQQSY